MSYLHVLTLCAILPLAAAEMVAPMAKPRVAFSEYVAKDYS